MHVQEILVLNIKDDEYRKSLKLRSRICPCCDSEVKVVHGAFYSNATGPMNGLVCTNQPECKALWKDPGRSFVEAHAKATRGD